MLRKLDGRVSVGGPNRAWAAHIAGPGEATAAAALLAIPLWMLGRPTGPYRAPGLEGDGLYGALLSAAWVHVPEAILPALLQGVLPVDPGFALGVVTFLGVFLAGWGPYRLARRDAPVWAAVAVGVAAQTSPVVFRAIPHVDLAALAVGPIALGLAHPRLAWIGGLWSFPAAIVFAVAGVLGRRPAWLFAGLPALAVLAAPSELPGALRHVVGARSSTPAYIGEGSAVFPLPPAEAAPIREAEDLARTGLWLAPGLESRVRGNLFRGPPPGGAPGHVGTGAPAAVLPGAAEPGVVAGMGGVGSGSGEGGAASAAGASASPPEDARPWIGAVLVPLQRIHGGPLALLGLLAALLAGPRRWGVAGLVALVGTTAVYGWQTAPGESELQPELVRELAGVVPAEALGRWPGGADGALAASAIVAAFAVPGLARLFARWRWLVVLALTGIPLENPRLAVPVAALPPDPLVDALAGMEDGGVLAFPAPEAPFHQGQRSLARWLWEAARAGRATHAGGDEAEVAAVVGTLTRLAEVPVDARAAGAIWDARSLDAFSAARSAGWRYLLVDLEGIPPTARPGLDGWLAERIGTPVVRDGSRLLYDLEAGPLGAMP